MSPANADRRSHFADDLAQATADAYSADRFVSWADCARALESAGYTRLQSETILRSKVTRWAADHFETADHKPTAVDLLAYLAAQPSSVRAVTGIQPRVAIPSAPQAKA